MLAASAGDRARGCDRRGRIRASATSRVGGKVLDSQQADSIPASRWVVVEIIAGRVRGFGEPANQDRRWRLREWRALKLSVLSRAASESRVKCLLLCPGGGKDWKRLRMISD